MNTTDNDFPVCTNCAADFAGAGHLCPACDANMDHMLVTITWRAFGEPREGCVTPDEVSHTFTTKANGRTRREALNDLFRATNLYDGADWDAMQPLPEGRSHTALSVIFKRGDYVTIDGRTYEVASFGFDEIVSDVTA